MQLTRRHRAFTLALAAMAGGIFLVFITRGSLLGPPESLRKCEASSQYKDLSFEETRRKYHWIMERLVEERMNLYEGETILQCEKEKMAQVIPPGTFAESIASVFSPQIPDPPNFTYANFEELLYEHWRTYDCHLFITNQDSFERIQARQAFSRLLTVLRSSEQYLPLHASLRCLQRGGIDVRNAVALISDASQCLPLRFAQPQTSILK